MDKKIKVLIVDDSSIVRSVLSEKLAETPDIEVVGTAPDPLIARDKILKLNPDVITLDIEMPRIDGLTFLEKLMAYYPMPVIIVSSITTRDRYAAIKALEMGAFDVVNKPGGSRSVAEIIDNISVSIRRAYELKDRFASRRTAVDNIIRKKQQKQNHQGILAGISTTDKLIAIGASTGGTVAIEYVLRNLPSQLPPVLIVQHMPVEFTRQFAGRLNELCALTVQEAGDDEIIIPGNVYIAMGGFHMVIERKGSSFFTRLKDNERVNFQKPSVDVLFNSIAENAGMNAIGVLLTGMGKDGAEGLSNMRLHGAYTVAQDEQTSVVWGMPGAAVELKAAIEVLPLDGIPEKIISWSAN